MPEAAVDVGVGADAEEEAVVDREAAVEEGVFQAVEEVAEGIRDHLAAEEGEAIPGHPAVAVEGATRGPLAAAEAILGHPVEVAHRGHRAGVEMLLGRRVGTLPAHRSCLLAARQSQAVVAFRRNHLKSHREAIDPAEVIVPRNFRPEIVPERPIAPHNNRRVLVALIVLVVQVGQALQTVLERERPDGLRSFPPTVQEAALRIVPAALGPGNSQALVE